MQIKLTTIIHRQSGRQTRKVETFEGPKLSFGRSASNDVVLSDRSLPVKCFDLDIVDGVVALRATDNQTKVAIDGIDLKRPKFLSGESQAEFKVGQYSISLGLSADQDMVLVSIDPGGSVGYTPRYGPGFRVRSKFANLLNARFLSWAGVFALFALFAWYPFSSEVASTTTLSGDVSDQAPEVLWASGKISSAHHNFAESCDQCHVEPFESVTSETCSNCHEALPQHASSLLLSLSRPIPEGLDSLEGLAKAEFGIEQDGCASCHKDHNGDEGVLSMPDGLCQTCHEGLDKRLAGHMDAVGFDDVSAFSAHGDFKYLSVDRTGDDITLVRSVLSPSKKDQSGISFSHEQHLDQSGLVWEMAGEQALTCASCHALDVSIKNFKPVEMETGCGGCHDLAWGEDDLGQVFQLEHASLAEARYVLTRELSLASLNDPGSVRPNRADGSGGVENLDAHVTEILLGETGLCLECHESALNDDGTKLDVVTISDFAVHATFNHSVHKLAPLQCNSCHDAEASTEAEDVLMPKIEVCSTCHADPGVSHRIESDCLMCHEYHATPPVFPKLSSGLDAFAARLVLDPNRGGSEK
ncbi:hypothetical protein OAN31_01865 [Pseudomonadales bacterium]|nr:hypothetical protein [Pseudomonadales bacterium]